MIKLSKFDVVEGGLTEKDPGARLRRLADRAYAQGLREVCEQRIRELYAYYDIKPDKISDSSRSNAQSLDEQGSHPLPS